MNEVHPHGMGYGTAALDRTGSLVLQMLWRTNRQLVASCKRDFQGHGADLQTVSLSGFPPNGHSQPGTRLALLLINHHDHGCATKLPR